MDACDDAAFNDGTARRTAQDNNTKITNLGEYREEDWRTIFNLGKWIIKIAGLRRLVTVDSLSAEAAH
jgi:hypothetical protein